MAPPASPSVAGRQRRAWASLLPVALLLASLLLCAASSASAADSSAYEIVSTIREDGSAVGVVRHRNVLFLLYDETIIGAEFDDPYLRKQTAYPGFTIMQCAAYLTRKPTRAVQIGLGIGSVPSFLREMGIPTDVVEISEAVVQQAARYFQYERCASADRQGDQVAITTAAACPRGETFVMDGLVFLEGEPEETYDLFVVDVYTGWNPFMFFEREVVARVRDRWLARDGVLVLNFVGYFNGPHIAAPRSIYRTLRTLFAHVKCFREMEDAEETEAGNIIFYASAAPIEFDTPTTREYQNPTVNTYFAVVAHFQEWEIFQDLRDAVVEMEVHQSLEAEEVAFSATTKGKGGDHGATEEESKEDGSHRERVLTREDHGQRDFAGIHHATQAHMRQRVLEMFPASFWDDFQPKRSDVEDADADESE